MISGTFLRSLEQRRKSLEHARTLLKKITERLTSDDSPLLGELQQKDDEETRIFLGGLVVVLRVVGLPNGNAAVQVGYLLKSPSDEQAKVVPALYLPVDRLSNVASFMTIDEAVERAPELVEELWSSIVSTHDKFVMLSGCVLTITDKVEAKEND